MRLRQIIVAICLCSVVSLFAEVNYKVTSSSRLNVRRTPSTSGAILGTFKSGEEITVLSINKGWAKVEFKNYVGYVSAKFIAELPKKTVEEEVKEETEEVVEIAEESPEEVIWVNPIREFHYDQIPTPLTIGSSLTPKLSLYLAVQGGLGYSNFFWDEGNVNGDLAFSGDIVGQLFFEEKVSFIPRNWYTELALGYDKKGAADFGLNYVHANLYPFGYRLKLSPVINFIAKAGVLLGFPLNDLETSSRSWSGNFQYGIGGGVQLERQQFSLGCNVEYFLSEVASTDYDTLHNFAILGTLTYKFAQFGHKQKH